MTVVQIIDEDNIVAIQEVTTPVTVTTSVGGGGGGAPSGAAGGVLGGTYPNPAFAVDMATQAELDAHVNDTGAAHAASAVGYAGGTGISATDVEAALDELATEKLDKSVAQAFTVSGHSVDRAITANAYTLTNVTTDRAFDANAATFEELADVLGTVAADLVELRNIAMTQLADSAA